MWNVTSRSAQYLVGSGKEDDSGESGSFGLGASVYVNQTPSNLIPPRTDSTSSSIAPGRSWISGSTSRYSKIRSNCTADAVRSEEHTSELQSRQYLVCRL